jgi:hypothetical protein
VTLEEHARHMIFIKISLSIDTERSILITLVVRNFRSAERKGVQKCGEWDMQGVAYKSCAEEKVVWGGGLCGEEGDNGSSAQREG